VPACLTTVLALTASLLGTPPPFVSAECSDYPSITFATPDPSTAWARRITKDYGGHAVAIVLLAASIDDEGDEFFRHAGDAAAWTGLFTEVLKQAVRRPRPTGGGSYSFPSGHTSAAFSLATVLSKQYPSLTPIWYGWAAAVGYSRIVLNRHRWDEVIVGGLLGILTARWAMDDAPSIVRHLQRTWHWGSAEVTFSPRLHPSGVSLFRATW
jgi:membrane-associated phospholipid phosphatase